jgi:hypothetical protein
MSLIALPATIVIPCVRLVGFSLRVPPFMPGPVVVFLGNKGPVTVIDGAKKTHFNAEQKRALA